MITAQWNINKISQKTLEEHGWRLIRKITEEWVEMGLGQE